MTKSILHIDASARRASSVTRDLSKDVVARLDGDVVTRDLFDAPPHMSESWIGANFTPKPTAPTPRKNCWRCPTR